MVAVAQNLTVARTIDIDEQSELSRIADEATAANGAIALRRNGSVVALLTPSAPTEYYGPGRAKTEADLAAFRAAAGGWKGFDAEGFKHKNEESRRISSRPRVDL